MNDMDMAYFTLIMMMMMMVSFTPSAIQKPLSKRGHLITWHSQHFSTSLLIHCRDPTASIPTGGPEQGAPSWKQSTMLVEQKPLLSQEYICGP
jgi:hypothetical protein